MTGFYDQAEDYRELPDSECAEFDPWAPDEPEGPLCEYEGIKYDTYGGEREWRCGGEGTVLLPSGRLMCEDHAGELGYGPKQEEHGFDPDDGPNREQGRGSSHAG